jgi:outer membrane protein assembly factor BamE
MVNNHKALRCKVHYFIQTLALLMTRLSNSLRPYARLVAMAALPLLITACAQTDSVSNQMSTLGGLITPYRIDILQGNVVVREQVDALQPGMSREQVRNVLGTPLLASAFHTDRWDYVFSLKRQGQLVQQRRVTVFFEQDMLSRFEADELPTEEEFVASLAARSVTGKAPNLEATEEQLRAFAERHNAASRDPLPVLPPSGVNYPPLESR